MRMRQPTPVPEPHTDEGGSAGTLEGNMAALIVIMAVPVAIAILAVILQ